MIRLGHTLFYVGIGAICHALFVGSTFVASSAWTWAWLLAWPALLASLLLAGIVGVLAVAVVIGLCVVTYQHFRDKYRRNLRQKTINRMKHSSFYSS